VRGFADFYQRFFGETASQNTPDTPPILVSHQLGEPNSETLHRPAPPTKSVIYAALGLPPRGDPPRFPDTPRALVVVDSRQSGPPSHRHPGRWDSVPEIAPVNPALAAMANALRVGDHLLTRLD
jgi:hypothetical protein